MVPLLGGVYVDEQGAREPGEDEEVRLEAEIAAAAEESENGEDESEGSPGDGDPGPMTFVVGEDDDENGRGGGVQLRRFNCGAGGIKAEPAGAEVEEGDEERNGDETKREAGVEIRRCEEGIDIESADECGEREEMRVIGEVFGGKYAADDDEEKRSGSPEDGGPGIGEREPKGNEEHERGEIRERAVENVFAFRGEEIFPAARDDERVGVEEETGDEEADGELEVGRGDGWRVAIENVVRRQGQAIIQCGQGLVDEHVDGGEQRDKEAEAAEENFASEDAGEDEHLRFSEPDDG